MQLETFSSNNNRTQSIVEQLLPFVKPFAYSWFNLQAQKRKYSKKYERPMPLASVKAAKEGLKAAPPSVKNIWAERLLNKLFKNVVEESRDDFGKCVTTRDMKTSCVSSQPDHQGKMRRIDCFKQADKIWRLDIVAMVLFKGIPLENTDSERLERVESCDNSLCVNPYHMLVNCKELDLYTSYHIGKSVSRENVSCFGGKDIILASVHSIEELLGDVDDDDDHRAIDIDEDAGGTDASDVPHSIVDANVHLTEKSESNMDGAGMVSERTKQHIRPNSEVVRQFHPKNLPRLVVSLQPSDNRSEKLVCSVETSRTPFHQDQPLRRPHIGKEMNSIDSRISQLSQRDQPKSYTEQPALTSARIINANELRQQQQSIYDHSRVLDQSHATTGMYFPLSNESMEFSQVITNPLNFTSTILTPSTLTFAGPLFMIHPINSETVFASPGSGTLIPIAPVMASIPHSKPPQQLQYTIEQLGISNYTKLASCPPSTSSTSSSSSSSFNLDQFLDFGQQLSSSSSPPKSLSRSISTFASNPTLTSTTISVTKTIPRKSVKRHHEESSATPRMKRQRRATVTGISEESISSITRPGFVSEASLSEAKVPRISSGNFLRSDRQEGFKVFQSCPGVELSSMLQANVFNSYGDKVEKPVMKSDAIGRQSFHKSPVVETNFGVGSRESPASDRGSPMPHIFTKELLLSAQDVSKPVAIFSLGNHLSPVNSSQMSGNAGNNDDDDRDGRKLKIDDEEEDKDSNRAFNGRRTYQASPFTIIPFPGPINKQVMVGYSSNVNTDGNNSNPVLCCFNAGGLLSPTPPFNLPSSPVTTPKTTPCSTPIPTRWCTPLFLEGDSETYPAFMVNLINFDEFYSSSESSVASSDKRSQTSLTPNLLPLGQIMIQEGANNDEEIREEDMVNENTLN